MSYPKFLPSFALFALALGLLAFGSTVRAAPAPGSLVKASNPAVYYFAADGKRYVFPDEKTYFTWYGDFGGVMVISDAELAAMPIGGNVRYRPGTKLIKITTDPKVYAVGTNGALRWLADESTARTLYGADWAKQVNDLSDAFFINYPQGGAITSAADYDRQGLLNTYPNFATLLAASQSGTGSQSGSGSSQTGSCGQTGGTSQQSTAITGPEIDVATTGSDSAGDGSAAKPYRTVTHALSLAEPGTTIAIGPGTYNEGGVRIRQPRITLTSSGATRAHLASPLPSGSDTPITVMIDVDADQTVLRNLEISGGFYAISMETRWDWGEADRSGVSDVTIEDCIVRDTGRDAIKVKPNVDRATIRRNQIYNTGLSQEAGNCNAEGIDNVNADDMLVEDNDIHDICSTGVYCKGGARNCRITGNRIWNTGTAGILVGFDTSPEYFDMGDNSAYYENVGATVRNNLVRNAGGAGIGLYASKDALIENNTVVNAGKNYHAPYYFGITYQDWEDYAKRPANINPTIRNNVFVQNQGYPRLMSQIRYSDDLGGLSALQGNAKISGNCYFAADGAVEFDDNRPGQEYSGGLAGWMAHMGETGSVETNPAFDADYRATASACAGKGWK
jgi:parallel beta-helix repeat protein